MKNIFDNAEEILDKTVLTYKENCVIPGYEIAYTVVFQDKHSLIYKLQVSNSSFKNFIKYKCIDVNFGTTNHKRSRSNIYVHSS